MPVDISIIVPCFNQEAYLAQTLESVLRQTYANWECIIVNDGSTDKTEEVARRFCSADNRFRYYFQNNAGVIAARNKGIINSTGKYILPLDGDDLIAESYVEQAVNVLDKESYVRVVYCKAQFFGESNDDFCLQEYSFKNLLVRNMLFATCFYRREDYERTGGYDPKMSKGLEDWEFWISLLQHGGKVYQLPEVLFYYRIVPGSRNRRINKEIEQELRKNIYLKHQALYDHYFGDPIEMLRSIAREKVNLHKLYKTLPYKIAIFFSRMLSNK